MPDRRTADGRNSPAASAPTPAAREHLLWEVADHYYVHGRSQKEIARRIGRSVATVSRLLAEGEANETIDVQVRYPVPIVPELQRALVARFGLRLARVAKQPPRQSGDPLVPVADLTARLITTLLTDGAVISVAGGTSVYEVARQLKPSPHRDVHVVQGLGSLGSLLPAVDNPWVAQMFAERLDGTPHFLPAPMVVESKAVRDALARDPQFCETLRLCARSDIALIGIGLADPSLSGICRAGYLDHWTMERIHAHGAIGDVMVEFFDIHGRIQATDIGDRVFGMRQAELASAGTVVAVARGAAKAPAILGALRTGLIDVLATDDLTARRVLELADTFPAPGSTVSAAESGDAALPAAIPDARADETAAIFAATIEELARRGYQHLTIDDVAERAGVSAREIGRRWRGQAALVMDIADAVDVGTLALDFGCVREDLRAIVSLVCALYEANGCRDSRRGRIAPGTDRGEHPVERRVHHSLRHALTRALEGGKRRGELDADTDVGAMADLALGAAWSRMLAGHEPLDAAFVGHVVTTIVAGNAPGRISSLDAASA